MAADDKAVWMYTPSFALAVLASVLYGLVFIIIFYLSVIKYRAWYFTCVVVGAGVEVAGYALRCYSIKQPTSVGPFAASLSLIVLAPVLLSAGNYLLIGRLIRAVLDPVATGHRVLGVHGRLLTRLFVAADVLCTLVQCSGSGIASSTQWEGPNAALGTKVLIGGLSLQAGAFGVFMCIFGRFHYVAAGKGLVARDAPQGWERVVAAVWVSSGLILVRCIYRVAEFAQGVDGYAFRHEWLFWVLEAAPMLVAIGVFCVFHPSAYLGRDGAKSRIRGKGAEAGDSEGAVTEL